MSRQIADPPPCDFGQACPDCAAVAQAIDRNLEAKRRLREVAERADAAQRRASRVPVREVVA